MDGSTAKLGGAWIEGKALSAVQPLLAQRPAPGEAPGDRMAGISRRSDGTSDPGSL